MMSRKGQGRPPVLPALAELFLFAAYGFATQTEPVMHSWVMTASTNASIRAIAPDVHSVRSDGRFVFVESAGISLHSFGALEANQYEVPAGPRTLTFRIRRYPKAAEHHMNTPPGKIGAFVTGVPIYNPIGTLSYGDRNIWHRDAVAASSGGISPLVKALSASPDRHSPIIGFAFDGYPIYGPFGQDVGGKIHRMRSSYQLRKITRRRELADGISKAIDLTPAQEGPAVSAEFPPGTFAEDYQYVEGSGDLDRYNGRFVTTPEYPQGTYAYFLATGDDGGLAWPYLIGPRYFGEAEFDTPPKEKPVEAPGVRMFLSRGEVRAGEPVAMTFEFAGPDGNAIRFLEKVHEQPIHLIVVSKDLGEFDHIHPIPLPGDILSVTHTFAHGGEYTLFANYTAAGEAGTVARFTVNVAGPTGVATAVPGGSSATVGGVRVAFSADRGLHAGEDLPLSFTLSDVSTGNPVTDLEPWLGAWGHMMIVSADREEFIHAHALEENAHAIATPECSWLFGAALRGSCASGERALEDLTGTNAWVHSHSAVGAGPGPSRIRTITGVRKAGIYRLWFQFQRNGEVSTVSFLLNVAKATPGERKSDLVPRDAIPVIVSKSGYEPSRIEVPANKPASIAFTRTDAQNCGSEVVFPELGIRKLLPPGGTVVVDLPASAPRDLRFACGMGMFRGAVVIK